MDIVLVLAPDIKMNQKIEIESPYELDSKIYKKM